MTKPQTGRTPEQAASGVEQELRKIHGSAAPGSWRQLSLTLASGDNRIPHGLGRVPVGWEPVRIRDAAVALYEKTADAQVLTLNASAAGRVELLVW